MLSPDDVRAAYLFILGREPESEEVVAQLIARFSTIDEIRCDFLNSREFRTTTTVPDLAKPLDWRGAPIETDASPAQMAQMLRHIEAYWRELDQPEVHWPLYQDSDFWSSGLAEIEKPFYADGKDLVRILRNTIERCGLSLDGHQVCFELGCGVGRVTVWLAELFHRIVAADISPLRLQLNKRALRYFQRTNVDHYCLESIDAMSSLPDYDVFFSVIVLQHNPPPIIVKLLKMILGKLRAGGIAYFQVPTFLKNYHFKVAEYLGAANRGPSHMEMHCIPQKLLFDIVGDAGCEILELREDSWTESNSTISNSLLVRRLVTG
jgi:SAM-dependent methyltransferase